MSSSPAGNASPVPSGAADPEWRSKVEQTYRNNEVREIAKVLAALEPGASASSKLRLAMQFEDSIYKVATSLADYHKRLNKRLKKLQKNFKPSAKAADKRVNKEQVLQELRAKYGTAVSYIVQNAATAVEQMRVKSGTDKALQLKQHTDGVKVWAADLGLVDSHGKLSNAGRPNLSMSEEQLDKLKNHLERRTENIRSHVVKLADPDRFLLETMEKTEQDMKEGACQNLADCTRKRYEHWQRAREQAPGAASAATDAPTSVVDAAALFQQALESTQKSVPPPTRNQRNDEKAALIHLDKMRAASTLILAYMMVPNKADLTKQTLSKANNTAKEGIDFVVQVMKENRKSNKQASVVTLEDAWMKQLAIPRPDDEDLDTAGAVTLPKRPVVRSRVLLTPGRKAPRSLLPALQRKRARLIQPEPHGQGAHLILEFGNVFCMTIYMVPLLVTLRAMEKQVEDDGGSKKKDKKRSAAAMSSSSSSSDDTTTTTFACASFTPLHHGLIERPEQQTSDKNSNETQPPLRVWGTKGSYETIGHVVEERLRDASAHATFVLRKCFEKHCPQQGSDFEVELREASALLEFISLSRSTYISNWQDYDG